MIIKQKTECASYQRNNHRKQNARYQCNNLVENTEIPQLTNVIITPKTDCASYQRNNHTENRMRELLT